MMRKNLLYVNNGIYFSKAKYRSWKYIVPKKKTFLLIGFDL